MSRDAFRSAGPAGFQAMLRPDRSAARSEAFDALIAASHQHYWNPQDPAYLDLSEPFDLAQTPLVPEWMVPALRCPSVSRRLEAPADRTRFINEAVRRAFSNMLHGEQGALSLSASLCHLLYDQGAQEFVANQAREEARHVSAFARYIRVRWGQPTPCGPALQALLTEIVDAPEIYKKVVGMQILIEGLAMGTFAEYFRHIADPAARRMLQLVMVDESFHHRFGKMWADWSVPDLPEDERVAVEDWTAACFRSLFFNLVSPDQQLDLLAEFGLDSAEVMAEFDAIVTDADRRADLARTSSIFRALIRTLLRSGLITERTRGFYEAYIDLDSLAGDGAAEPGEEIASDGLGLLGRLKATPARRRAPTPAPS